MLALLLLAACASQSKPPSAPAPAQVPAPAPAPAPDPEAPPPSSPAASTGIPECDEYLAVGYLLASCENIPADARQAQRVALDEARASLLSLFDGKTEIPPEAMKSIVDACRQSAAALAQAVQEAQCEDRD